VKQKAQDRRRILARLAPGLASLLMGGATAGCLGSSPAVEYYTFETIEANAGDSTGDLGPELAVGVGPVDLPGYLDRQQIVTRPGGSRVRYDEFNRWVGMLDSEIPRALGNNLRVLLASDRIVAYPTIANFPLDYRVTVEIERFDAERGGEALLVARFIIQSGEGGDALSVERSDLRREVESRSYSDLAAAHSELLADLSRAIAAKIRAIDQARRETRDTGGEDAKTEAIAAP